MDKCQLQLLMPTFTKGGGRKKRWANVFSSSPSSKANVFSHITAPPHPRFLTLPSRAQSAESSSEWKLPTPRSGSQWPAPPPARAQGQEQPPAMNQVAPVSGQSMVIVSADQTHKGRQLAFPRRPSRCCENDRRPSRCGGSDMTALPAADLFLLPGVPTEVSPGGFQELFRSF